MTVEGAKKNYGVIVDPVDYSVKVEETEALRSDMKQKGGEKQIYDRGGDLATLQKTCFEETGLKAPVRQWEFEPYGPHTGLKYVQDWYKTMREKGGWDGV